MVRASSIEISGLMEARWAVELPEGDPWWFEPRWDRFRCLAFRDQGEVRLVVKSGMPPTRCLPEVVHILGRPRPRTFGLDGELIVADGGRFSVDALRMRPHPAATRIRWLSHEIPAVLTCFDLLLSPDRRDLRAEPLRERRRALDSLIDGPPERALDASTLRSEAPGPLLGVTSASSSGVGLHGR
jgi:ATP-dependent DNA ligase